MNTEHPSDQSARSGSVPLAHGMPAAGDVSSSEGVAADELRAFIERIERLEEERSGLTGDISEVMAELKGRGFDAKAVATILRMRKKDHSERQEEEAILELYMQALGMV